MIQIYEEAEKSLQRKLIEFRDREQNTALLLASKKGHADIVKYLVEQAEEISEDFMSDCVEMSNNRGFTPMIEACLKGYSGGSKAEAAKE